MDNEKLFNFIKKNLPYIDYEVIGKSVLNQNIYAITKTFDKKYKWVLITGGIHAREHLSTNLICKLVKDVKDIKSCSYNIACVPLVNPDGAMFCIKGIKHLDNSIKQKLYSINNNSYDFTLFKANANGVDLNNNWDAKWEKVYSNKYGPSAQGYYGFQCMTEPEVKALEKFTKQINPFMTINYHLKGEEIYFDFFQNKRYYERDKKIAKIFANSTGYKIVSTQNISSGGYKDWCVEKFKIPSLTIELGNDNYKHPFPQSELLKIYQKNKYLFKNIEKSLKIFNKYKSKSNF